MTAPQFANMDSFAYAEDATVKVEYQFENGDTFWIEIRENGGSNTSFSRLRAAIFKPHQRKIDNGSLPDKKMHELVAKLYSKTVIVDWGGICGPDGKDIECTQENAYALLVSYPRLADKIIQDASLEENFIGGNEAAIKNSQAPSDGGSSGANN